MVIRLAASFLALFATASAQLTREAATAINLPAELPAAAGYVTQNAFAGLTFSLPMQTAFPPAETNRLFVVERGGTVQCVSALATTPVKTGYFSLTSILLAGETLRTDVENGFLSLAFHPDFATNGTFFVYFSMDVGGTLFQRLHQVTVTNPAANTAVIAQHKPLLTILDRNQNHNGGDLHFGADGFLYLSLGDEGGSGDNRNNARFINHRLDPVGTTNRVTRTGFWGQLLRLAVEKAPIAQPGIFPTGTVAPNAHVQNSTAFSSATHGNYRVPADNPFHGFTSWHNVAVDPATVRTEIFATGLRNPFRWSFDPPTGRIFLADVGQGTYEEVNIIAKGNDMGWSWREGLHPYPSPPAPTMPPEVGFNPTSPIYEYDHVFDTDGLFEPDNDPVIYGTSITGGIVYRSGALSELYGKYIFSDYNTGFIVALTEGAGGAWTGQRLATDNNIADFGVHPGTGEMLMCDLIASSIKRLVRTATSGTAPPDLLSATGVFSNVTSLTPSTGVVAYAPNVDFWSDYAIKSRWFAIRNPTDTVVFSTDGNWTLPAAMVWVKHFDIDTTRGNSATRRKLETRILVKTATDVYGLSYKWRPDQTNADLVPEEGLSELIPSSSPAQTWRYPSRIECRVCHTAVAGSALSFNTRQMNRTHTFGAETLNQITALGEAGYFSEPVSGVNNLPAFASASDTTASREWRVRSYLAVNCIACHQPGGVATGNWDARSTTPTDLANLIGGVLVNNGGDSLNRWCVAEDPAHSMILNRLSGTGFQRMPPLATNERDLASEQLITDWIMLDLPSRQSFSQWTTAYFPSGGANSQPGADPDGDGQTNSLEFLRRTSPLVAQPPLAMGLQSNAGLLSLTFDQPAGRGALIETSVDLHNWSPWDVPGNQPTFPASTTPRLFTAPLDLPSRFLRLRLSEP
jgi:glucose/arabinose dehydrogenase